MLLSEGVDGRRNAKVVEMNSRQRAGRAWLCNVEAQRCAAEQSQGSLKEFARQKLLVSQGGCCAPQKANQRNNIR
jgi:hypothetical protein